MNLDIGNDGGNGDNWVDSRNIYEVKPAGHGHELDTRVGRVECV